MNKNLIKIHLFVSGRVQRVFYRWCTIKKAKELEISGWVRNRNDSRVEAIIVGPKRKVEKMLKWFWRGSPMAKVKTVKIISKKIVYQDIFSGKFKKRSTI